MPWPWKRKPETFASFTDSVVNALLDAAGGQVVDASTTAAVEFCAAMWQRTVSSAEVQPAHLAGLLTPHVLGNIARTLVLYGQAVAVVEDGGLVLASGVEVTGGPQPSTWRFKVTLPGPSRSSTLTLGYDDVLRFTWSTDPRRPWQGIGPLQRANVSAALVARLESRMSEEASAVSGHLLSVPVSDEDDKAAATIAQLQEDLRALKGRTAFVRTTRNWTEEEGKPRSGVPGEYVQKRIGALVPDSNIRLREMAGLDLVAATGIPSALYQSSTDGTASRAATGRFLDFSVQPVADAMAAEFSRALGVPVTLGFEHLRRADTILTMSRAVAALVKSGLSVGDALDAVGLED